MTILFYYTGLLYKAIPWLGEFYSCCCLALLPQLGCRPAAFSHPGNGLIVKPCTLIPPTLSHWTWYYFAAFLAQSSTAYPPSLILPSCVGRKVRWPHLAEIPTDETEIKRPSLHRAGGEGGACAWVSPQTCFPFGQVNFRVKRERERGKSVERERMFLIYSWILSLNFSSIRYQI